jgi:hypothetical protein
MWKRTLVLLALTTTGAGCTTPQPPMNVPDPPADLMVECERPAPIPEVMATTASNALATVTANYARQWWRRRESNPHEAQGYRVKPPLV